MKGDHWKQIDKIKVGIDKHVENVTKITALAVHGDVTLNTPVDTSRARSNWWTETGSPSAPVREADQGAASMAKVQAVTGQYEADQTIYISNDLPYIRRLNEGHSAQAPAGFVESAVQVGTQRGKEAAKNRGWLDEL